MNYIIFKNQKMPVFAVDNKKDTTLLFLHGLNSNSQFIEPLLEFNHNFNIVSVNFTGSKYSPKIKAEKIILEDWIDIAKIVLQNIKTKNVYILAHSMAGAVAVNLANDKRVKKIFMLATVNYSMMKNSSYSLLKNVIGTAEKGPSLFGKLFVWGAKFSKKGQKLTESFSRKGKWYNLLEKYILNPEFMEKLDAKYREISDKLIFIIGDNDSIIGTDNFINYGNELKVTSLKIGYTHSPIKTAPYQINNFLNLTIKSKKRFWPWGSHVKFSKNVDDFSPMYDAEDLEIKDIMCEFENN
ncbi:alpha/beta fold hydrolase [Mycoplasma tauri]|nr:alpha/beta fold hydrolase [Mycoplasma tauri]